MRFSGHETFPFRYAWLPKAFRAISQSPDALADDDHAIELLGLGKNMVRAARFWLEVTELALRIGPRQFSPSPLGDAVLGEGGHDPFLEDERTLWLLHWHISSRREDPLFAWQFLLNHWQHPELCQSDALEALQRAAPKHSEPLAATTLRQHLDVFMRSYVAPRVRSGSTEAVEDVIDCPLAALALLERVGERRNADGRSEPVYRFRRDRKEEITPGLFVYCLNHFWSTWHAAEQTLAFRHVATGVGSPGQLLKLPEDDLRARLERIEHDTQGAMTFRTSATHPGLVRSGPLPQPGSLLDRTYAEVRLDG